MSIDMTHAQETTPVSKLSKDLSIDLSQLNRVGARPAFLDYLVQVWDFRSFIIYDARARVKSGTRRDKLGSAWLLLNPIFNGATYFLIFGLLLGTGKGIPNFISYLIIGVFMFQMNSGAITGGARSIQQNRALIKGFTFPRAALPLGVSIREILVSVPLLIAMLLLILVIPPTEPITWRWLLIFPVLTLQFLFNLGVGMIFARLLSQYNDLTHILPFIMRAIMYMSAIFYSYERFIDKPILLNIMQANPVFIIIDITRDSLLYGVTPTLHSWVVLTAWSLGALVIGSLYFWRGEESYVRS